MMKYFRNLRAIAQTRNELSRLSDRELNDLGLTRGDIETVARQTITGQA
jgi:uncharacterized protein YjiS (DUF1127 family)